jgi:hypothetical protein
VAPTLPSADTEGEEFEMVSEKPEEKPEEPKLRRKAVCEAEVRIFMFLSVLVSVYNTFCFVFLPEPTDFLKSVGLECLYALDWPTDF